MKQARFNLLRGRHGEFLVVSPNKDCVSGGSADSGESEEHADRRGGLDLLRGARRVGLRLRVVVGGYSYADADGY